MIGDAIGILDPELYADVVRSVILASFDAYESGAAVSWQRVELALCLLYGFGGAVSGQGSGAFVVVPALEVQKSKADVAYKIDYTQFPLSPLGEMMLRACRSKIVAHPHASVSLQFFEVAVRYHEFFKLCPEYIQQILPSFLDEQ